VQETVAEPRRRAKLNKELADRIRFEAKYWRQEVLAKRYGVALPTIRDILSGKTWKTA
jgi:hypothetical protein